MMFGVWPAYLATLLRKFDPKLYESLADRDQRSRTDIQKQKQEEAKAGGIASHGGADANISNEIDNDSGNDNGVHQGYESPPPDYSPRSSEAATSPRSSASSQTVDTQAVRPAVPAAPAPGPDLANAAAGPGVNLFRFARNAVSTEPSPSSGGGAARSFQ